MQDVVSTAIRDIYTVSKEIEAIEQQIQPLLERLKVLRKERTSMQEAVVPQMKQAAKQMAKCAEMSVEVKPKKKVPPFNAKLVGAALAAFFSQHGVQINVEEVMKYIEDFRQANAKMEDKAKISGFARKKKEPTPDKIQVVEMDDMQQQAQHGGPSLQPYVFGH